MASARPPITARQWAVQRGPRSSPTRSARALPRAHPSLRQCTGSTALHCTALAELHCRGALVSGWAALNLPPVPLVNQRGDKVAGRPKCAPTNHSTRRPGSSLSFRPPRQSPGAAGPPAKWPETAPTRPIGSCQSAVLRGAAAKQRPAASPSLGRAATSADWQVRLWLASIGNSRECLLSRAGEARREAAAWTSRLDELPGEAAWTSFQEKLPFGAPFAWLSLGREISPIGRVVRPQTRKMEARERAKSRRVFPERSCSWACGGGERPVLFGAVWSFRQD